MGKAPLFAVLIALAACEPARAATNNQRLTYCVPVHRIDWNPFRELKDGKELAYLLFTKSYLPSDSGEEGILSAFEFSPDGKRFVGRVAESARWADGTPVTPLEAAIGIAEGFRHRPIGQRVAVLGGRGKTPATWGKARGIHILNEHEFQLDFESSVRNLTGVIREALSAPSRHNRVWPVRLTTGLRPGSTPEVLLEFPSTAPSVFLVAGRSIQVVPSSQCGNADFSLYPEALSAAPDGYEVRPLASTSAVTLQINTVRRPNITSRRALADWVKRAFAALPRDSGFESSRAFFLPGEPGYADTEPTVVAGPLAGVGERLTIAAEIPLFRRALEAQARRDSIHLTVVDLPLQTSEVDAQILSSGIQDGRQIILQDLIKWNFVDQLLGHAPKTRQSLEKISELSASTIPPDNQTLQAFAKAADEETSLVPIGRRHIPALTRKGSPIVLTWDTQGSPTFVARASQ